MFQRKCGKPSERSSVSCCVADPFTQPGAMVSVVVNVSCEIDWYFSGSLRFFDQEVHDGIQKPRYKTAFSEDVKINQSLPSE